MTKLTHTLKERVLPCLEGDFRHQLEKAWQLIVRDTGGTFTTADIKAKRVGQRETPKYSHLARHFEALSRLRVIESDEPVRKLHEEYNWTLNENKLTEAVRQLAEDAYGVMEDKMFQKLGPAFDGFRVRSLAAVDEWIFQGEVRGRQVTVQQRRTFNWSSNGNPYMQWPARIYVDGDFTSAKVYKEMMAD